MLWAITGIPFLYLSYPIGYSSSSYFLLPSYSLCCLFQNHIDDMECKTSSSMQGRVDGAEPRTGEPTVDNMHTPTGARARGMHLVKDSGDIRYSQSLILPRARLQINLLEVMVYMRGVERCGPLASYGRRLDRYTYCCGNGMVYLFWLLFPVTLRSHWALLSPVTLLVVTTWYTLETPCRTAVPFWGQTTWN